MSDARVFSLEPIRTDGWFERIGEGIASFRALCEIIGPKFFAFAMVGGARITALTVDRRVPDNTLVDFVVGSDEEEFSEDSAQRVSLAEFRRRLVTALIQGEPVAPPPDAPGDIEALQQHVGVRCLLLAPLFGYTLLRLRVDGQGSHIELLHEGEEESYELAAFRARLRDHVREEFELVSRGGGRGAIDLGRIDEAERAALAGDPGRVLELLGSWPAPLAMFLRTAEGQALGPEGRATIARGLSLLGSACIDLGDLPKGEEILRLAIQYSLDGVAAPDVYRRLGEALLADRRSAEAIGLLRRAQSLGGPPEKVLPPLAQALIARQRRLAALGAIVLARAAGVGGDVLAPIEARLTEELGPALVAWREAVAPVGQVLDSSPASPAPGSGNRPSESAPDGP